MWGGLGLIVGSFVNVLILREGKGSLLGRSACPACGTTLQWFELVPVLSWALLRGRCRTCRARISLQYPLVELLVAAGFIAVGLAPIPLFAQIISAIIVALLVAIAVYDLYHTIIPDRWSYSFGAIALLLAGIATFNDFETFLWYFVAGPLVALPLFLFWLLSKGMWMGLGDAKLALGIGWLLGILDGYVALAFAFMIGAFVGVFILIPLPHIVRMFRFTGITRVGETEGFTMKSEVPFGPFLICSLCIVWFAQLYGYDVTALFLRSFSLV